MSAADDALQAQIAEDFAHARRVHDAVMRHAAAEYQAAAALFGSRTRMLDGLYRTRRDGSERCAHGARGYYTRRAA